MNAWLAIPGAVWLGLLTSISPCPLTTNIAAVSYLVKTVANPRRALASALLYVAGRTVVYAALAAAILAGLSASDALSRFLQRYMNLVLGPILILAGLFLLGLLGQRLSTNPVGERTGVRAARGGPLGAFLLGGLFALAFCPVSAGLFFGGLLPLATAHRSWLLLPALYGIGTAIPVAAFALLVATGSRHLGRTFEALTRIERWVRLVTGWVFVLVGLRYTLIHVYGSRLP